jgi:hypothetical protein
MRERQDATAPADWVDEPGLDDEQARQVWLMRPPGGHPELVLARAVDDGVITSAQAELIALTRWQRRPLTEVAAERGTSYKALQQARRRAERRLAAYLTERAREIDPARTSVVEAHVLTTTTLSGTRVDRPRRAQPTARTRGPVLKPTRKSGVNVRGEHIDRPAHPTPEVPRCA